MKKIKKGDKGYIINHRLWQGIRFGVFAAACVCLFLIGYISTKTKLNYFTIFAMVGTLPTAKELIGVIMSFRGKPVSQEFWEDTYGYESNVKLLWELVFTTYEKTYPVDVIAQKGKDVIGYAPDKNTDVKALQNHIQKILKENGYEEKVKIYTVKEDFIKQLNMLSHKEEEEISYNPNPRYPSLTRDELVCHTILALSL